MSLYGLLQIQVHRKMINRFAAEIVVDCGQSRYNNASMRARSSVCVVMAAWPVHGNGHLGHRESQVYTLSVTIVPTFVEKNKERKN